MADRRSHEGTGEVESLYGKLQAGEFGSRAKRTIDQEKEKLAKKQAAAAKKPSRKPKKETFNRGFGFTNILAATEDLEGLQYTPKTKETKEIYDHILSFIQTDLGDVPQDVLRGAVDEVLAILKDESLKDFDKKTSIESITGPLPSDRFASLVNLGKRIIDYTAETAEEGGDENVEAGVTVAFDESEEEDEDEFEVNDQMSEDEDVAEETGGEAIHSRESALPLGDEDNVDVDMDDSTTIIPVSTKAKESSGKKTLEASLSTAEFLNPHDVDAFWLQRNISSYYSDPHISQTKTAAASEILSSSSNPRDCENELMELFDYDKFDLVKLLTRNRDVIVWCTKLARAASPDEAASVKNEMIEKGFNHILQQLESAPSRKVEGRRGVIENAMELENFKAGKGSATIPSTQSTNISGIAPKTNIDIESLIFQQGGHLMTNKKCKLPEGSKKISKKGYEEVHVPAPVAQISKSERLVPITELPKWAQKGFIGAKELNRIQSVVYPTAFKSDENMLLCAPTGAGKTNCAMLTMLREIGKYMNHETGELDLDNFKIIYIAPMKALVAEMVGNFGKKLSEYGIKVAELTGDRQLTKAQIAETQVIVTTPEKWDIITRKATDRSYTNVVRLIIMDEIHLLHDERGPVLECIVSRTLRHIEQTQVPVRLVGLSATLPNYLDVATFLRVNPDSGLFFFDNSYRPCPLQQQYIGITEKKAIKRFQLMNDITYDKVMEEAGKNQILIFVHSRKETVKCAKTIRDMALERGTIGQLLRQDAESKEILQADASTCQSPDLQDLLPYGFGVHHAGMSRPDRMLVEENFARGHIQVLVSTATLAWGVNLPAHTVIIRGTQVYSPEKGKWTELSPQDVLQMLGRAGRPQFDTHGEGIIITTHNELQYYLSLLNIQLPIESQFISKLSDNLNAEIALGTIRSREDAVHWLGYTYLYVRMLRNGALYGVTEAEARDDPYLEQKRVDLVHAAAMILDKCGLVKYDRKTGKLIGTELGRIASHYYISNQSMATYNMHLKPTMSQIDLFRAFALSDEFKYIPVREEEKLELAKMLERVPIPVKESMEEPTAKINVLLQSYVSQLKLEGFALMADMVYVTQSAGRILRAIFEICMRRGWAQLSRKVLDMSKMVHARMWLSMNPLRQFKSVPTEIIKRLEKKEFSWYRYYDLNPQELGELAGMPKAGNTIHKFVHQFPKLDLQVHVQPITRSILKVDLTITPDFRYDEKISGAAESFVVLVEDVDSEFILYSDNFILKQKYAEEAHHMTFTVELFEPLPPNYFVSIVSDRWLHCETRIPISFKHLIVPEKYHPHTELLDLQPLPPSAFKKKDVEKIYKNVQFFNPIQTQVFNTLYSSDENSFVGAPSGCGKTVCAEFALLRLWSTNPKARCVYIGPFDEVVEQKLNDWKKKFEGLLGGKNFVNLTGETSADLKLLEIGDVIFATPQKWDMLSRRWKQRKSIQTIGLFIADEIHLVGGDIGPTYEVIVSRMRYISVQTENKIRIVALGTSLANARDLGEWIGASAANIYNFHPSVRPVPLEIHIQGYNIPHFASLMIAMTKPAYIALTNQPEENRSIVFVPSRKQCRTTAVDLLTLCAADGLPKRFLHCSDDDIKPFLDKIEDKTLAQTLEYGVAFYHEALSKADCKIVQKLYDTGAVQVVVASKDTCWSLPLKAKLVLLMGTQYYEGKEHRYADYQITDVLQMLGRACIPVGGDAGKCLLMCQNVKKDFYKKFLYEALPVESHLDYYLHDHFNAEIVTKTIENKQEAVDYLTWTFFYRRLVLNPNYYNLQGDSATQRVGSTHLSDHLSELVENTLEDLSNSKCISIEEDDVSPLNLGMIAAYYYINYVTMELFSMSLTAKTKLRGLLEIISAAAEFEDVPIRHHEGSILKKIYDRLPVKIDNEKMNDPHIKTNILLQSHFSRVQLPADLESDQKIILSKVVLLIQACVDVISSNGWLAPALAAMEMCQMVTQAIWDRDSPLRQVPHLSPDMIENLKKKKVVSVFDLMEMEDEDREEALPIGADKMGKVAEFVNRYPNVEVNYELEDETVEQGGSATLRVLLEREAEDEDDDMGTATDIGPVIAPFYPKKKDEGWWVVLGDPQDKSLLAIKRTTLQKSSKIKLDFKPPENALGKTSLKIYVMCDSYAGVDQEYDLELNVVEGEVENSEGEGEYAE